MIRTYSLPPEIVNKIDKLAKNLDMQKSDIITEAITIYGADPKKAEEMYKQIRKTMNELQEQIYRPK